MGEDNLKEKYLCYAPRVRNPYPLQAALLLIDIQEYLRDIAKPTIPTVEKGIRSARKAGIRIISTQHSHKLSEEDGMLWEWWDGNLIGHRTPDAELVQEVGVSKHVYSAFVITDFDGHLRNIGRLEVILTGFMTKLCCETTARDVLCRGYGVFFSSDATATSTQEFQEATLRNVGYGFAYLVDADHLKFGEG